MLTAAQTPPTAPPGTLIGFVPVTDAERSKAFYTNILGLTFLQDDGFALSFRSGPNMVRLAILAEVTPATFTILGWEVTGIEDRVRELADAGVVFQRYGFLQQDDLGIWTAPDGNKVAWFPDPDGNLLSLSQH